MTFTGIVAGKAKVSKMNRKKNVLSYALSLPHHLLEGVKCGASIAIDGVCQTVVMIDGDLIWFDAIEETLERTTLNTLKEGDFVNVERAACLGDEIGGHLLTGHVFGKAALISIKENVYTFKCPQTWMKYLFEKGFIAIDGMSLTLVSVEKDRQLFSVHLIPETLRQTTLASKEVGSFVNLEFEAVTQAAVDTVERLFAQRGS